jgi:hypothetical protein
MLPRTPQAKEINAVIDQQFKIARGAVRETSIGNTTNHSLWYDDAFKQ